MNCPVCEQPMIGVEYPPNHPQHYDGVSEWWCEKDNIRLGELTGQADGWIGQFKYLADKRQSELEKANVMARELEAEVASLKNKESLWDAKFDEWVKMTPGSKERLAVDHRIQGQAAEITRLHASNLRLSEELGRCVEAIRVGLSHLEERAGCKDCPEFKQMESCLTSLSKG